MRFIGRYPAEKCQPISGLVTFGFHHFILRRLAVDTAAPAGLLHPRQPILILLDGRTEHLLGPLQAGVRNSVS